MHKRALTLVELLIVIIVIGILVSSILVASSGFISKGRTNNTQAVLQVVADAVEEFKREQTAKPTITRAKQTKDPNMGKQPDPPATPLMYSDRYGLYPPDELEVFTLLGLPGSQAPPASRTLAPGGAVIVPAPTSGQAMRFYKDGDPTKDPLENRDQAAMIVAIETLSESASAILDRIPDKNRSTGALSADGTTPALFLDRPDPAAGAPNGAWDSNDHQIRLIIDDWGMPISYLAQRDWQPPSGTFTPIESTNHAAWNEASTELIRMNGGQPIIMSYGPNGKDQLTKDAMGDDAKASLVGDFEYADDHVVNNPLNDDNVYSNPALKEKLAKGIKP
jgi:prepilin-type N-terminal cleavage/methylation domain-containing protein